MKRILYFVVLVSLLFSLEGCLTTLYPIFHPEQVIFNERLLGYWECADGQNRITYMEFRRIPADRQRELSPPIRAISDSGYFVSRIAHSGDIKDQYIVFLVKIGGHFYMDFYPVELPSQKDISRIYKDHQVPLHSNYRLDMKDRNHFEIRLFEKSFLEKLMADNKINIRHENIGGKNLVTASTDELQQFIRKYGDDPDAYAGNITSWTRFPFY